MGFRKFRSISSPASSPSLPIATPWKSSCGTTPISGVCLPVMPGLAPWIGCSMLCGSPGWTPTPRWLSSPRMKPPSTNAGKRTARSYAPASTRLYVQMAPGSTCLTPWRTPSRTRYSMSTCSARCATRTNCPLKSVAHCKILLARMAILLLCGTPMLLKRCLVAQTSSSPSWM